MNSEIGSRFRELLGEGRDLAGEPMSRHTTFRIGGPADHFLVIRSEEELAGILRICREEEESCFILGNGSNLLVSDKGFRGTVIQICKGMNEVRTEGEMLYAQAGALLSGIARTAMGASLTGLEFAGGIPGTLGGAVVMNAGAYGGELKDVLKETVVMTMDGRVLTLPVSALEMTYRNSLVKREGYIVLRAVLALKSGDAREITGIMAELSAKRSGKQPLEFPSAGSTFKRPEGFFAGKLIEEAGLRGYREGGAQVSEKHCGFVINTGNATAHDVAALIKSVQKRVYENSGVKLEPEVKFLGEFEEDVCGS